MLGKTTRPGFSFLQLIFVVAIVGVMSAIVIPNLFKQRPLYEQKAFVTHLNAFLAEAWQRGLITQKVQKIVFDLAQQKVILEQESDQCGAQGASVFTPVVVEYAPAHPSWPHDWEIRQFFVQGADEMASQTNQHRTANMVWFFILPGGLSQEVIINMVYIKDKQSGLEGKKNGLVLNPFTVQFKTYDEFQNPA